MVYINRFLRLVAIGTIYEKESFSFSMSLMGFGPGPLETPTEVPASIISAFGVFFPSPGMISSAAALTTLKLNLIGTDGKYVNPATVLYDYPAPVAGSVSNKFAAQLAYAVSLETMATRGRAHAGRFYLPVPAQSPSASGALDDTAVGVYANPTETLLRAINDALPDWRLGIVSNIGTGTERIVKNARYGRILDVIRSRRDKLPEDYIVGPNL
jgi:hypothetical protein